MASNDSKQPNGGFIKKLELVLLKEIPLLFRKLTSFQALAFLIFIVALYFVLTIFEGDSRYQLIAFIFTLAFGLGLIFILLKLHKPVTKETEVKKIPKIKAYEIRELKEEVKSGLISGAAYEDELKYYLEKKVKEDS